MFYRWWRIDKEDRTQLWLLYGWFAGLMCLGSMFGAVEWGAWMKYLEFLYIPKLNNSKTLEQTQSAQQAIWQAVYVVTHAVEFLCLSVAKLMVLDRIKHFAAPNTSDRAIRWEVLGRVVMVIVVVGNVVGVIANVSAAAFFKETADLNTAASAAYAINPNEGSDLNHSANQKYQNGVIANSVQLICEVSCLLVIILAFAVVGVAGAQRLRLGLRDVTDERVMAAGMQVRRQILGTTVFVFLTFLLRAVYSIMNAAALAGANNNDDCVTNIVDQCDSNCFNVWAIIQAWIYFTPEFPLTVELISSPLALLVALWGMTSTRTLRLMSRATRSDERNVSLHGLGAGLVSR